MVRLQQITLPAAVALSTRSTTNRSASVLRASTSLLYFTNSSNSSSSSRSSLGQDTGSSRTVNSSSSSSTSTAPVSSASRKASSIQTSSASAFASASTSETPPPFTKSSRKRTFTPIRLSQRFSPTSKSSISKTGVKGSNGTIETDPLPSLELLLRGGYIRSSSSGIFSLLPNGLRILDKLCTIIDQEMFRIRATRLSLPTLLSARLWKRTGRYDLMHTELFKLSDRKKSDFLLAPTHEEEITNLIAQEVASDRQLPIRVYQITKKFRDEPRPRMGVLRTKEFWMKDLYSFDATKKHALETYEDVRKAYNRIFDRVFTHPILPSPGSKRRWKAAEADTGAIGGNRSHEYHIEDPSGEDTLLSCTHCDYVANTEKAVSLPANPSSSSSTDGGHIPVSSSDLRVILVGNPDIQHQDQVLYAMVLPKSRILNSTKLEKFVSSKRSSQNGNLQVLYDSSTSLSGKVTEDGERLTNRVEWDWKDRPEGPLIRFSSIQTMMDFECASIDPSELNDALTHVLNTYGSPPTSSLSSSSSEQVALSDLFPTQFQDQVGHDVEMFSPPLTFLDLREAEGGDVCSSCRSPSSRLKETKAIEVGHTFYLGTRYSQALDAGYVASKQIDPVQLKDATRIDDESGKIALEMGCYGIGVSRILGALAQLSWTDFKRFVVTAEARSGKVSQRGETGGGASGFLWPRAVAPFTGVIIISDVKDTAKCEAAERLHQRICALARQEDWSMYETLERLWRGGGVGNSELGSESSSLSSAQVKEVERVELEVEGEEEGGWDITEATELVIDDRAIGMGSKLADSELVGYRFRLIVGRKYQPPHSTLVEIQYLAPNHPEDGNADRKQAGLSWKSRFVDIESL